MTIHATAITFHDCRIHLEPIGPEPSEVGARYRFHVEHCAGTEAILGTAIRQWTIGKQPANVVKDSPSGERVTATEVRSAMEYALPETKRSDGHADSPADMRRVASVMSYNGTKPEPAAKHLLLSAASQIDRLEKENRRLIDRVVDMTQAHADAVGEGHELRAEIERLNHVASENGKSCLDQHKEIARLKGINVRLDTECHQAIAERDEARQMHKERVFWEKAALNDQIAHLDEQLTKLRVAAQNMVAVRPGQYIGDQMEELRKALG